MFFTSIQMPGVSVNGHWWDSKRGCTAVRLNQFALMWNGNSGLWAKSRLQRSDAVKLHSGQTAYKAGSVIPLYQHWVNETGLCRKYRNIQPVISVIINTSQQKGIELIDATFPFCSIYLLFLYFLNLFLTTAGQFSLSYLYLYILNYDL